MAFKGKQEVEKRAQALERLEVKYVPIDEVSPNTYNPNRQSDHDFELLLRSMREDGFTQPIIVHRDSKEIVDGEHRWRAAHTLGMTEIPVVYVDMTTEQMRIATLRHNRARGSEDIELAGAVLRDLAQLGALDWAQDSLMLDEVELDRIMEDLSAPEALAAEAFGQAWEPDGISGTGDNDDTPTSVEARPITSSEGGGVSAMSFQAVEAARQRERELAQARTAEERDRIRREAAKFFRLVLMFQGDEAELVRGVLGEQPAEKLVAVIREHVERHPELAPAEGIVTEDGLAE